MADHAQVTKSLDAALAKLQEDDRYLFVHDANERSLSHRLAMHLQSFVDEWEEGWDVDCEHNRDASVEEEQYYSKRLQLTGDLPRLQPCPEDEHARTVFPDVIVHRRGGTGEEGNLLVVEVKKTSSGDYGDFDRNRKLPAYCDQLGYQYTAFVLLHCRGQCGGEVTRVRQPHS